MEIEYKGNKYSLIKETKDTIVFEKINSFKKYTVNELAEKLSNVKEEYDEAECEAEDHQKRVDEFRYCGYNEEDREFHGMCVYQNKLDNEVSELNKEYNNILSEIEKRLEHDSDRISDLLCEYGVDY